MIDEYTSDDGPGSDLFDPYETGWWKSIASDDSAPADQPCPNCNGEGYVVIRVCPWDGCSYDEKPVICVNRSMTNLRLNINGSGQAHFACPGYLLAFISKR